MNDFTLQGTYSPRWTAGLMADTKKYAACKNSNEVMRVDSNGALHCGADRQPIERYEFDTYKYAEMFCRYVSQIEEDVAPRVPVNFSYSGEHKVNVPAASTYECIWADITYRPTEDKLPNRFYRKMSELFFGCEWRKVQ